VYSIFGPSRPSKNQLDLCIASVKPLLMKSLNSFCDFVYDGQVYQF
jgi:hypothetical protein